MAYWWSLKNNRVEQGSRLGWFHGQRLGPYDTEEQARGALAEFEARNKQQDAEDTAWRDGTPDA